MAPEHVCLAQEKIDEASNLGRGGSGVPVEHRDWGPVGIGIVAAEKRQQLLLPDGFGDVPRGHQCDAGAGSGGLEDRGSAAQAQAGGELHPALFPRRALREEPANRGASGAKGEDFVVVKVFGTAQGWGRTDVVGARHHEAVASGKDPGAQVFAVGLAPSLPDPEGDVDAVVVEALDPVVERCDDFDLRVKPSKLAEQGGKQERPEAGGRGKAKLPLRLGVPELHRGCRIAEGRLEFDRVGQEHPPGFREGDLPGASMEQGCPEVVFQAVHLATYGGRRDAGVARGSGKGAGFGNFAEQKHGGQRWHALGTIARGERYAVSDRVYLLAS